MNHNHIFDAILAVQNRHNDQVAKATEVADKVRQCTSKAATILCDISRTLDGMKFDMDRIAMTRTGLMHDEWQDGDGMKISFLAVPREGCTFKFLADQGYTASGSAKNGKALEKKARALEEKLGHGVHINQNFLEDSSTKRRNPSDFNRILVELWVKP